MLAGSRTGATGFELRDHPAKTEIQPTPSVDPSLPNPLNGLNRIAGFAWAAASKR